MKYNFDNFVERSGTNSVKWEHMKSFNPASNAETLPFWVADMDFHCAQPILDALHKRIDNQIFGYCFMDEEYRTAICNWYERRFSWKIDSGDIFYSPGVVPALGYLIQILTKPGDGVLIQRPVYYPFSSQILDQGRKIINNPLLQNDGYYTMDFEDLEEKAKNPDTTLMILCSPHNPVGRVWKEDELRRLVEICSKYDVKIISDEIHCDIVRRGITHLPLEKVVPEYKNAIITTTAPSKTFNLAGLQVSNIIIHDEAIKKLWNDYVFHLLHIWSPNILSLVAVKAAYNEGEDWLEQVIEYIDENIQFMRSFLAEKLPLVKFTPPEGTYLTWLDFSAYQLSSKDLDDKMIHEANILLDGGTLFGDEGASYQRINIACSKELLEKGLNKLAKAFHAI